MTLDLLDTPVRISWRLVPEGPLAPVAAIAVAERLVEAGVFFVHLEGRPLAHPAIDRVLRLLDDGGIRITLACQGTKEELPALQPGLPIDQLFLNAAPVLAEGNLPLLSHQLEAIRNRGFEPGLLLVPRHENVTDIPRLLQFCRDQKVARFKLPNVAFDDSVKNLSAAGLVTPEDLEQLGRELRADAADGLELEIHDLFLWELLGSGAQEQRGEYGGCQAANSLGHVDASGNLHPCSSWPENLGSLLEYSLAELWARPERHRIREEIAATPEGCRGCRDWETCFGGCRGLARRCNHHQGDRDPMCRGPRN